MPVDIDFSLYVRAPRLDADGCVVLANRLALAAPTPATPAQRKAMRTLGDALAHVESAQKERARLRPESLLPYDQAFDAAWGALHARLSGLAKVPTELSRDAARATELMAKLFADGLRFLSFDFESEWVESKHKLERIVEEDMQADLARIVGADVLNAVRITHQALGDALGLTSQKRARAGRTTIQDAITQFGKALVGYTRVLLGELDVDDEEAVQRFRVAVAAIDDLRITNRARGAQDDTNEIVDGEPGAGDVEGNDVGAADTTPNVSAAAQEMPGAAATPDTAAA